MIDTLSHPAYGSLAVDRQAKINNREVTTTAQFKFGMGFYADGAAIVSNQTFYSLTHSGSRSVKFGLIKVLPGTNVAEIKDMIKKDLPFEVMVFDRSQIIKLEQDNFISIMPIGIMVRIGVLVSFLVGAVILFQVLSTEISNRLDEYATLKAAGFTTRYIYGVGFQQALIFAIMSYLPAVILAYGLFHIIHLVSRLPIFLTFRLSATVLSLALLMCLISGFLALRKIRKADPVDLF
jgi:putative ABC transport system permease protein